MSSPGAPRLPEIDAYVQAGGRSTRMGSPKAFLEVGGVTLLERVLGAVRPVARRTHIVTNQPVLYERFGAPLLPDHWPGAAALGGIGSALLHAETSRAIVLACDLPFLESDLLRYLVAVAPDAQVTLPETDAQGLHPLCAVYARSCLASIERRISEGQLKVSGFFEQVSVRVVPERELVANGFDPRLLDNLNTPEELERARRSVASRPASDA